MQRVNMHISLTLQGPLLTQSSAPGELGLDLVAARRGDKFSLPATLVAGKLRQALEELQSVKESSTGKVDWFNPQLDIWLGKESYQKSPKSKQLYFSDFELETDVPTESDHIRHRITIYQKSRTVERGQLVMMENPFVSGHEYQFTGKLHFFSPKDQADTILKSIKTGFNWFSQLGAMKSTGFGQVKHVGFNSLEKLDIPTPGEAQKSCKKKIGLHIRPLYPFCLSGKPVIDNLFESEAIIPGGAIIGSIATTWSHLAGVHDGKVPADSTRENLRNNFSKIRISHGFPGDCSNRRPVVPPLSLVKVDDDSSFYDVALLSHPSLINDLPPAFCLDWKDDENTLKCYPWPYLRMKRWGWPSVTSELRVHTGIDRAQYRSKKAELFAYNQIVPGDCTWYAEMDLSRIEDDEERAESFEQLKTLLHHGIIGLGKTKTVVDITFTPSASEQEPYFPSRIAPIHDALWCITLQTDTLLGSPDSPVCLDETSGADELEAMYRKAWHDLSAGELHLVRYFARQKLSGGGFRHSVFQAGREQYRPWLLTEAGSIFVLRSETGDIAGAKEKIQDWLNYGLPLSDSVISYYEIGGNEGERWKKCPFLPQNGYGEIAVNIETGDKAITLTDEMVNAGAQSPTIVPIGQPTFEREEIK